MTTRIRPSLTLVLALAALVAACERPPVESTQTGFRGLGMEQINNPRLLDPKLAANVSPEPSPPASPSGPKASETWQNVQVLGDLSVAEFTRLMASMTAWVSPEQGCNYCHNPANLASDDIYQKVVARRMLQMTRDINANWKPHVAETGVTCYTCHRGQPVPSVVWSQPIPPPRAGGMSAGSAGQNLPGLSVGLTSLPYDPKMPYFVGSENIRVQSNTALPVADKQGIKTAEATYGLMIHISESLGVNCTHCHNTRSFMPWEASSPARVNAWHAIRMVRQVNEDYIGPLASILPADRKGPAGDALKVDCGTCHRGLPKPLQGVSLAKFYPALTGTPAAP